MVKGLRGEAILIFSFAVSWPLFFMRVCYL